MTLGEFGQDAPLANSFASGGKRFISVESEGSESDPPSARQVALRMPADRWKATVSQL